MNTTTSRNLIRLVAGPVAAAGILSGALGLAAVANASTNGMGTNPHTTSAAVDHGTGTGGPGPAGHGTGETAGGGRGDTQSGTQG
jgi:hypothetical protein